MANLRDFFNKISNDNRIFTAEDIGEMSSSEFSQNEKAIDYQLAHLGVPKNSDIAQSDDVIYVNAYVRDDGTKVRAHYRSKSNKQNFNKATNFTNQKVVDKKIFSNTRGTIDDYSSSIENISIGIINKKILDLGINIIGRKGQEDAMTFWNIASRPFWINNEDYINKNGKIYNNIKNLGIEYDQYKPKIIEKVKSQFGNVNVLGIVFHENSTVSNAINQSQELNNFVLKNITALKSGKEITGSISFTNDKNLHNTFGKVDILSAKLNSNNIDVILLDTYDFNPNEKNWIVQMGYNAQKVGLLNPYFTIVRCRYKL
ncbi:MAG: hypothetical protein IKU37_03960 [Candidatus Gastranaerophilales bacterium]|nr:hypothetical protein [Candidatus Gastranaerophilales bacterium]